MPGSSGSDFNTHDVVDLAVALRLGGINDDILNAGLVGFLSLDHYLNNDFRATKNDFDFI